MFGFWAMLRTRQMNQNQYYVNRFLDHKSPYRPKTVTTYHTNLKRWCSFVGDDWPPTTERLEAFFVHCRGQGLSEGTVWLNYRALKTWILWLFKTGALTTNPLDNLTPPPKTRRRIPRAPAKKDVDRLLATLESEVEYWLKNEMLDNGWVAVRDMALISLMVGTGLRVGEVDALQERDVEIERQRAYLQDTKGGGNRYVKYSRKVASDLRLWLMVRHTLPIPNDITSLFVSFAHKEQCWHKFTHWGVRQMLRRRCQKLGLKIINPHALRHYFSVQSLRNGASLIDVKNQLGHLDTTTTNIYSIAAGVSDDLLDTTPR